MKGLISYDLVMGDSMSFVEGTFRLPPNEWQVFIISKRPVERPEWEVGSWDSGVTGIVMGVPLSTTLNVQSVEALMSQALGLEEWERVVGPDSMALR